MALTQLTPWNKVTYEQPGGCLSQSVAQVVQTYSYFTEVQSNNSPSFSLYSIWTVSHSTVTKQRKEIVPFCVRPGGFRPTYSHRHLFTVLPARSQVSNLVLSVGRPCINRRRNGEGVALALLFSELVFLHY